MCYIVYDVRIAIKVMISVNEANITFQNCVNLRTREQFITDRIVMLCSVNRMCDSWLSHDILYKKIERFDRSVGLELLFFCFNFTGISDRSVELQLFCFYLTDSFDRCVGLLFCFNLTYTFDRFVGLLLFGFNLTDSFDRCVGLLLLCFNLTDSFDHF